MQINYKKHSGYDPLGDCGKGKCPVCARNNAMFRTRDAILKDNFTSDGVAPFVVLRIPKHKRWNSAPPTESDDSWMYDAPKYWAENRFEIPKLLISALHY